MCRSRLSGMANPQTIRCENSRPTEFPKRSAVTVRTSKCCVSSCTGLHPYKESPRAMTLLKKHPQDRLSQYADGELPSEEMQTIKEHLATCADCHEEVTFIREVNAGL